MAVTIIAAAIGLVAAGVSAASSSSTAKKNRDSAMRQAQLTLQGEANLTEKQLQEQLDQQRRTTRSQAMAQVAAATIGGNTALEASREANQARQSSLFFAITGFAVTTILIVYLVKD